MSNIFIGTKRPKEQKFDGLMIANNPELGVELKVYGSNEEPLFKAGDVALTLWSASKVKNGKNYPDMNKLRKALNINESATTTEKFKSDSFVTEKQLYKAILKSGSPKMERMYDWLSEEILPNLRKKGYAGHNSQMNETLDNILGEKIDKLNDMIKAGRRYGYVLKDILINDYSYDIDNWLHLIQFAYSHTQTNERLRFLKNVYELTKDCQNEYRLTSTEFNSITYEKFNKVLHYLKKEESAFKGRSKGKTLQQLR